ncbi:hypothetical protein M9Y10_036421 [Tritrichomonas musculus]|uniref:Uncharacterized protein n=1 Tax=Tritrichomonas musculus TaxID=1915356 RepID=A0ABR2GUS8_9EUKA
MRDSGEPDDVITKILRKDDVDGLQSDLLTNESQTVPFNIFESFINKGKTNFIDYDAAYGSVKCFKYLLDNKYDVSKNTLSYAVFGQSNEIIELTDQIRSNQKKQSKNTETLKTANAGSIENNQNSKPPSANQNLEDSELKKRIIPAIMKHNNGLFVIFCQTKRMN